MGNAHEFAKNNDLDGLQKELSKKKYSDFELEQICRKAIEHNRIAIMEILRVECNYDMKSQWIFFYAATHGKVEMIKYLIVLGADINWKNNREFTAIEIACHHDNLDIVKYLNECGAKMDIDNLLVIASQNSSNNVIPYLIELGANINCENGMPLFYAIKNEDYTLTQMLLNHGANPKLLEIAVSDLTQELSIVDLLIDNKVDPIIICKIWNSK